ANPGVVINPLPRIETNSKRHDIFGDEDKQKPGRNESHTYKRKCEVKMSTVGNLKPFDPAIDDIEVWIRTFKAFLLANNMDYSPVSPEEEPSSAKTLMARKCVATLLSTLGLSVVGTLISLLSPEEPEEKTLEELFSNLRTHYKPAPKALAERYRFMSRKQNQGESTAQYLAELRRLAINCKFDTDLDTRLRDQFIFGLRNEVAQKQLFTRPDEIKLEEVVAITTAHELSDQSLSLIRGSTHQREEVNKIRNISRQKENQDKKNGKSSNNWKSRKECTRCGSTDHNPYNCPHKDSKCYACGKQGHLACKCRNGSQKQGQETKKQIKQNNMIDIRTAEVLSSSQSAQRKIWITVKVNGIPHRMEMDTGCERSIISKEFWEELGKPALAKSTLQFRTYTNQIFYAMGELECNLNYNNKTIKHVFPITRGSSLFGRDLLHKINVNWSEIVAQCNYIDKSLSLQEVLKEFADIFEEPKGYIKNFKAKIILKDDAIPKFMKPRPIPYAIQEKVNRELDLMEKSGVIKRIDHSEWASPLVVVPKPNRRVRITGDLKNTVNSHVTQYPLATPEQIFHTVSGSNIFSKLDGNNAYHQMEVEEECKKFLVVNTHRGLYQYNVLPQSIASSPAIFQEFADKMLQDVRGTSTYIDDTLAGGKSEKEHLQILRRIFKRMREYNFYLSKEKCELCRPHVEFLGHILSEKSIHTDPNKIAAIEIIQRPQNVTELKSFLGLVNFYNKFVPNFASFCEPLYRLTRNEVEWQWTSKCETAFNRVKSTLSGAPILTNFDPDLAIGISCDASSIGVGSVLFHRCQEGGKMIERPIAFASRVLSAAEKNYSQIEKEGLAIICALKKFYRYLCGRRFILITDHKPLLSMGPKTSLQPYAAARLHRWNVYMSQFEYDIEYRPTVEHGNADALSRLPDKNIPREEEDSKDIKLITTENIEMLPVTLKEIRTATARDKVLSKVLSFISSKWPNSIGKEDEDLHSYFRKREELTIQQGVIMWGIRVVIPYTLQKKLLQSLHETHTGIVKMKGLARQYIWWPNMDKEIEDIAKSCTSCCASRPDPPSAPLHPWQFPEKPWQRLHIDLAGPLQNRMFLIIMDAHTKWPEVYDMHGDTTSKKVIEKLRDCFVRFGIPEQIISDNGRQFVSAEFKRFCRNNGIRHTTSSAYHPRTNGEAERFVQTFKKAVSKSEGELIFRVQRFLFSYRCTPHTTTGTLPAELLIGRRPRNVFDLVKPDVQRTVAAAQARQEKNYNSRVRNRKFEEGEKIWVRTYYKNEAKWSLGVIVKVLGPVTYLVRVGDQSYKRHVDQIYNAMPIRVNPGEEEEEEALPDNTQIKQESESTPSGSDEEQENFETAESSDTSEAEQPSPQRSLEPETVPSGQRPQRNRKQPNRLEYYTKGNPKGYTSKKKGKEM
ncbi:PREDICTED: uncharacterized protein K02A2.6-like, partial [Vollenhovia emeryi]|uniref:uncharacterized protein K02A2.6-like n=1 Tax=Vollenhovia emeryi TaxID=411798 RepID=UPI0005F3904D